MRLDTIHKAAEKASNQEALHPISQLAEGNVYPESVTPCEGGVVFLACKGREKIVHVLLRPSARDLEHIPARVREQVRLDDEPAEHCAMPCDHETALLVRRLVPWARPQCLGTQASLGLGDRLGLATPGHVQAVRGTGLAPIFAQQSIREMERTGRTPEQVLDTATFGVLQSGWRAPYGSDADHLKTVQDISACLAAGFTMFTVDPGDHVVNEADQMQPDALEQAAAELPWDDLETSLADCRARFADRSFDLPGDHKVAFTKEQMLRALVKYGKAVAHTIRMQRELHVLADGRPYELEMSVDETDSPTAPREHFLVASELRRVGLRPVSLAPRFVGRFEKGVDYIGDLQAFERDFAVHAAIARALGPYKISLHSGSDKFSVYDIAARHTEGLMHVKTAGTSYLEALRAAARIDPALFRDILAFAREHYDADRRTYHVSASLEKIPSPEEITDDRLGEALDQFDARQALHVTYGSVLAAVDDSGAPRFRDRLYETLEEHEEEHYACLARHLRRHAQPFAG